MTCAAENAALFGQQQMDMARTLKVFGAAIRIANGSYACRSLLGRDASSSGLMVERC
jgi:hypothetical protein